MNKLFFAASLTLCNAEFVGDCADVVWTYVLYIVLGFLTGGGCGFYFSRMPNYDYTTPMPERRTVIACILVFGVILAGIGAMAANLKVRYLLFN